MKKLLLYVGLLTINGCIEAAAAHAVRCIIWEVGVSGEVHCSNDQTIFFGKGKSRKKFNAPPFDNPLIVRFDYAAKSDDESKLAALRPASDKSITRVVIKLPPMYASWDKLPLDASIVLRYSASTKVAASLMLPLTAEVDGVIVRNRDNVIKE